MYNNELMHYGRKGMKWGQRIYTDENGNPIGQGGKSRKELKAERKAERKAAKEERAKQRKLESTQKDWERDVSNNWYKAYNNAANKANSKIDDFNNDPRWKDVDFSDTKSKGYREYTKAYCELWNDIYIKELDSYFGKAPIDTGKEWCERVPMLMDPFDFYEIM